MRPAYTVRHVEHCSSLEEAVQSLMDKLRDSRNVYRQFHRLPPHQGFPVHRHFTTNEWLVVYDAEFDFVTRQGSVDIQSFGPSTALRRGSGQGSGRRKATVIHIPIGTCHTVRSRASALRYAVVKDGPDDFNPC